MDDVFTLGSGRLLRSVRVRGPENAHNTPLPVVLILHGSGGTAAWTLTETGWGEHAETRGFLAVLPEGTRPEPEQPPEFTRNPQVWNTDPHPETGSNPVDDVTFLSQVLDEVSKRYSVDESRFYTTGFSNGASMTFLLGTRLADRLAALAPVAGHCLLPDPQPTRPVPTLFVVGTEDPFMPLEGGPIPWPWRNREQNAASRPPVRTTIERWARGLGCGLQPEEVQEDQAGRAEVYTSPGTQGLFQVQYLTGLGHHWPGGKGLLNPRLAGPPSAGYRATERIWKFFSQHRL